jgi:hypothetical protein
MPPQEVKTGGGAVVPQTPVKTEETKSTEINQKSAADQKQEPPKQDAETAAKNAQSAKQHAVEQRKQNDMRGDLLKDKLAKEVPKKSGGNGSVTADTKGQPAKTDPWNSSSQPTTVSNPPDETKNKTAAKHMEGAVYQTIKGAYDMGTKAIGGATPPTISSSSIQQNLNGVQVGQQTQKLPGLAPNSKELNELADANTPSKRNAFKPLQVAYHQKSNLERKVGKQEQSLEKQKKIVDESKKGLSDVTEAKKKAQTAVGNAEQKLAKAKTQDERKAATGELQKAKADFGNQSRLEQRGTRSLTNAEKKHSQIEKNLTVTKNQVAAAEKNINSTSENLQKWVKDNAVKHNKEVRAINGEIKEARASLTKLKKAPHPDAEKVKQAEEKLKQLGDKKNEAVKRVQTAADNFEPLVAVDRNHFNVNVGGKTIQLHDNVIAYAASNPKGMDGKAAGDGKAAVKSVVDRTDLSKDKKDILKKVSEHEGSFSTVNTWDRAVVTAGFVQWTTGEKGDGSLVGLMSDLKTRQPQVFRDNYQKYGIDVDGKEIKVTQGDGKILKGADAAKAIQTDPKLAAVLSAAGTDSKVQDHQVAYAARTKIDNVRNRHVTVGGQTVQLGTVINSKYAVGVMMDRAVHSGEGRVDKAVTAGLTRFLSDNKGAKLSDPAVQAKAQKYVAEELTKIDPNRAKDFGDLSKDAGSFSG